MIKYIELKEISREYEIPISTIERDYAQNWILKYLSEVDMVLKGGTGIKKVYFNNYRFSDDLDFTLVSSINKENLNIKINTAIGLAIKESSINFNEESFNLIENTNGFECNIYFKILNRSRNRLRIKIDITGFGKEIVLLPILKRNIIHKYSDNLEGTVLVYSMEEIFAEKIRTLFDRTRPRDLYDVWALKKGVDLVISRRIIKDKFYYKHIDIDFINLEGRKKDFEVSWHNSLRHQLRELPDFNSAFSEVIYFLKEFLN
jgi:uncharacterized protein